MEKEIRREENNLSNDAEMTLAKIKKQEIIDSLVSDIKSMYMSLSDKNKVLEDKEKDLFVKYIQLDQREKEMQSLRERTSGSSIDARWRSARFSDNNDMFGPSDNLDLVMDIKNAIDHRPEPKQTTRSAFVKLEKRENDVPDDEVHAELERLRAAEEERIARRKSAGRTGNAPGA